MFRSRAHPRCRRRTPTTSSTFAIPTASHVPMLFSAPRSSRASYSGNKNLFPRKLIISFLHISSLFNRGFRQHHIVFLHGVTQRAMRTALANFTVDWFETEPNPPNGSVLIMRRSSEKDSGQRWTEQWCHLLHFASP